MLELANIQRLQDALSRDCWAFLPELVLCGGIVLLLLVRLFRILDRLHLGYVAMAISLACLWCAWMHWQGDKPYDPRPSMSGNPASLPMFSGLLVFDNFTIFLRVFLLFFVALVIWLSLLTGIPDREDSGDFYVLLLGATLGMCVMSSANHLLMVFIGVEMASLPSYALAGFLKGKRKSSEASLKYVVYGGAASGVMLYGISLLAGKFGTGSLPALGEKFVAAFQQSPGGHFDLVLVMGTLFLLFGLAFKLSAVPFHFWCPDVFEGASAEVAGFLSVASKGAAMALLARVIFVMGGLDTSVRAAGANFDTVSEYLLPTIAVFAAITATFGNLAAYLQTNLKRLLAYSTIAHAGYMMMGLATLTKDGAHAVLFYLVTYLFTNLGAFAVIAFLRNVTGSEDLSSFRGLIRRSPLLVITFGVFMLSLLGLPPLAGFAAKIEIFAALFNGVDHYTANNQPGLAYWLYALIVIAGVNTVISAVYYLKVMKVMALETTLDEVEGRTSPSLDVPAPSLAFATALATVVLILGLLWGPLDAFTRRGVDRFQASPPVNVVARGEGEHP